uniref:MIF4G domain containing protein n=1 Tax=Haemonchus contortus TaxID=6289 RepID=W6NFX1_HAECO
MTDWPRLADQQWVQETNRRVEAQESHRSTLVSVETTDENALHSLDSTLKKTTAFMKKLKTLSAASIPSLIDELSRLNLSKFVEEMAAGIAETKLKPSDVIPIVDLCVAIASRYPKFSELILAEIRKGLPLKRADKISNPAKLRIDVRLLCELILCGVVGKEGLQTLGATLSYICITDKGEHSNVGLICSLCRPVGWQIAGIVPSPEASEGVSVEEGDLKVNEAITPEHRKVVNDLFSNYHTGLIRHLEKACAVMNVVQKKVKRHERTRGATLQAFS